MFSLLSWLLAHRRALLAAFALVALAMVPGTLRLETDNSPEVFYLHGSAEVERYRQLQTEFGADEAIRIVVSGPGLWTPEGLRWMGELEEKSGKLEGVARVHGLAGRHRWLLGHWPPTKPSVFRQLALADNLDRQLGLVSADGEISTLIVLLEPTASPEQSRRLGGLRQLLASAPPELRVELVGMAVIDEALDGSSREIQTRFFPLLVLFTVLLLIVTFRNVASVLVPLVFVAVCGLLTFGPMGYLGARLNMVLAVLPPLAFVIGLATAVHLLTRYRELLASGLGPEDATLATYRDKGWAVLWTGVTTMVGFGSLAISHVGPVKSLGIWSSVSILVLTVAAFLLYPLMLATWVGTHWKGSLPVEGWARLRGRRWATAAVRQRQPLLLAMALVAVFALAGLPRLRVESNALTYLETTHPVRVAIAALESHGIGPAAVELVLTLPRALDAASFRSPSALVQLEALAASLRSYTLVRGVVGAGDVSRAIRGAASALGASPLAASGLGSAALQAQAGEALKPFVTPEGKKTRLTIFVPVVGFDRLDPLVRSAMLEAQMAFPQAVVEVTGQHPLLLETQRQLLTTLSSSLAITLLCVAVILGFLVGSRRLATLALLPNIWPVLGVVGAMGWLGIPLDVATVMVASVVLGIAVDDTIHTLGHFRELAPKLGTAEAVASTLEHTAGAYVLTGAMLIAGFGVCALSSFAPTARFGLLSALGIFLAVIGDLFLVPALLGKEN